LTNPIPGPLPNAAPPRFPDHPPTIAESSAVNHFGARRRRANRNGKWEAKNDGKKSHFRSALKCKKQILKKNEGKFYCTGVEV